VFSQQVFCLAISYQEFYHKIIKNPQALYASNTYNPRLIHIEVVNTKTIDAIKILIYYLKDHGAF